MGMGAAQMGMGWGQGKNSGDGVGMKFITVSFSNNMQARTQSLLCLNLTENKWQTA